VIRAKYVVPVPSPVMRAVTVCPAGGVAVDDDTE
jgi:hypothetical protein